MIKNIDHVTLAVTDVKDAKKFFTLLGFEEERAVIIEGDRFSTYMHINNVKADHITLALKNSDPRFEIQLLKFDTPALQMDPYIRRLDKIGYNHMCFAVEDIDKEVNRLRAHGIKVLSDPLTFNQKKLAYIEGPDGVIVELAQLGV